MQKVPLNPRATNPFSPAYDLRDPTWRHEPSIAISLWFPFGFPSVSLRFPFGFPSVSLRFPFGFPSVSLRFPFGFLRFPFGFPLVSLRFPFGFPSVSLRFPFGSLSLSDFGPMKCRRKAISRDPQQTLTPEARCCPLWRTGVKCFTKASNWKTSTWANKTINQLFASNETSLLLKLQPPTNSEKCGDFAHGFLRTGEVAANPSSVAPVEPAVPASNEDRTVFFSRANTANTFSDIVESFPVFVSVSFGELGKQCRNRVFQKNTLPLSSFSEQVQVSEFNWYWMSFVGGLLLGSIVVFHTLQKVVFKGAWLRNVQKHVLLSASGQNRDTASNKASSLTCFADKVFS